MTRINLFRTSPFRNNPAILDSVAWGKINLGTTASPLVFAAILIVCSFAVGCSSEKPKPVNVSTQSNNSPAMQPAVTTPISPAATPASQPAAQTVQKKVVRRKPANVTYTDKTSGVSFQYPRKYALKTGDAVADLISSNDRSMNFMQPGGVALAAVTVPEGAYPKSDLASAFFNVSVNKSLTAEQCGEFPLAQDNPRPPLSKLMIGDMELQSIDTLTSAGPRQEMSKFYHAFENGDCYEFALQVATTAGETEEGSKAVDRDEVFQKLEKILATVKIQPRAETPEVTANSSSSPATPAVPAQ
jgi:hypothetical protein